MSALVQVVLLARRTARASSVFAAAAAFAALPLLGVYGQGPSNLGLEHGVVAAAWLAVFGLRLTRRVRDEQANPIVDLELGLLLLVAMHMAVQLAGGVTSGLHPLIYALVAFAAAFARKPMGALLVVAAISLEAALYFVTEARSDPQPFVLHAVFIALFGLLNLLFTRAEIARVRHRSKRELDDEKKRVSEDARIFRLVSAPTTSGVSDEERLFRSSVEEVHNALYYLLDTLRRTLELHTCVLLMLDDSGKQLQIVELVTDSDHIADGPFPVGSGAVGAVASRGVVMNLEHVKLGYGGLCYYDGPASVRAFVGIPVIDQGHLRGVLCADRRDDAPFGPREEQILQGAIHQILRTLENERVFVQLERSKREQTVLYRASQALGAALDQDAVIDAVLAAAADVAPHDFAAVTFYNPAERRHTVRRAIGEGADALQRLSFRDNASLTAMAVKNRHYLPYRGELDPKQQVVFTRRTKLRNMRSLLIMPLLVREDVLGTVALAARRVDAFTDAVRPTLQVLANQMAVALANAAAVQRLEDLATIDGLTGCLNKRAFTDAFENKIRAAERFDRRLSLIVTDIDLFKAVNDTYGHATGDVVIRELGEILHRVKRETDVVARFGGEEFCVLCEETDTAGAVQLAERIREELSATAFQTDIGKVSVTCSLGVATFPLDARSREGLFSAADRALYAAKHSGRDAVRTAQMSQAA